MAYIIFYVNLLWIQWSCRRAQEEWKTEEWNVNWHICLCHVNLPLFPFKIYYIYMETKSKMVFIAVSKINSNTKWVKPIHIIYKSISTIMNYYRVSSIGLMWARFDISAVANFPLRELFTILFKVIVNCHICTTNLHLRKLWESHIFISVVRLKLH